MKSKIKNKIRAGYPLIYVDSKEETRTLDAINQVAKELSLSCYAWTLTRGMFDLNNGKCENITDPVDFIRNAIKSEEKAIYIIIDPHPFMNDPMFARCLKDGIPQFSNEKRMILIGTAVEFPPVLKHLVETIKVKLPTREELKKVVGEIAETNEKNVKETDKVIEAISGLTTDEAANAIAEAIVETGNIEPSVIMREKCDRLSGKDYLKVEKPKDRGDIGGLDNLVEYINKRKDAFSPEAKKFGLPTPKGILLVGIPGCGKSLTAKAASSILGLPLIRFDVGALMGSLVGQSEHNTRDAIEIAEAMSPCVLWIDELDKQLSPSGGTADGAHEVTRRVMASLLTWLQEKTSPVFIVATANNIRAISTAFPELLRKGRWDEIFFVDLPDLSERKEIFKIHIHKQGRDGKNFDVDQLAENSKDFTGAEIEAVVRDAMYSAFDEKKELSTKHIVDAISRTTPQAKTMPAIKELREWADGKAVPATAMKETKTGGRKVI